LRASKTEKETNKWSEEIIKLHQKNQWMLGFTSGLPTLVVASKAMHNVPKEIIDADEFRNLGHAHPAQFSLNNNRLAMMNHNYGVFPIVVISRSSMRAIESSCTALTGKGKGMLQYIIRRLLLLIPIVLLVSMIIFFIIQLPPGDFVSRIAEQLRQSGEVLPRRTLQL
jgi:hypothetical protein